MTKDMELIELEKELLRRSLELKALEVRAEERRFLPHQREFTKIVRSVDDSCWWCIPFYADRGDVPASVTGIGDTPHDAQVDFDRAWREAR